MEKIKFENVTGNYNGLEEFYNDCNNKEVTIGAFYIKDVVYEDYDCYFEGDYVFSKPNVRILYSIFDPIQKCILEKLTFSIIREDYVLSDSELDKKIKDVQLEEISQYIKKDYKFSRVKYTDNGTVVVEYL